MSKTVSALYDSLSDAHGAVLELTATKNFDQKEINVVSQDTNSEYSEYIKELDIDEKVVSATQAGAGAGATAGMLVGALAGLLIGTSVILLPGVGTVLALGPVSAMLAGAGAGALIGSLTGALVGIGIDQKDAELYTEGVHRGGTLVLLRAEEQHIAQAMEILKRHNPIDIEQRAAHWRSTGWSGVPAGGADGQADPVRPPIKRDDHMDGHTGNHMGARMDGLMDTGDRTSDRMGGPASGHLGAHVGGPMIGSMSSDMSGGVLSNGAMATQPYVAHSPMHPDMDAEFRDHLTRHPPSNNTVPRYEDHRESYAFGAWLGERSRFDKMEWEQAQAEAHKRWADKHSANGETWEEIKHRVQYGWHRGKAGVLNTGL